MIAPGSDLLGPGVFIDSSSPSRPENKMMVSTIRHFGASTKPVAPRRQSGLAIVEYVVAGAVVAVVGVVAFATLGGAATGEIMRLAGLLAAPAPGPGP